METSGWGEAFGFFFIFVYLFIFMGFGEGAVKRSLGSTCFFFNIAGLRMALKRLMIIQFLVCVFGVIIWVDEIIRRFFYS